MANVGFVPIDSNGKWMGGRYYLQHLIRSVAALPGEKERLGMCDVWWEQRANHLQPGARILNGKCGYYLPERPSRAGNSEGSTNTCRLARYKGPVLPRRNLHCFRFSP